MPSCGIKDDSLDQRSHQSSAAAPGLQLDLRSSISEMNKFVVVFLVALLGNALAKPAPQGYSYQEGGVNGNIGTSGVSLTSYQPTAAGTNYYNRVPSVGQINVGTSGLVPSTQISGLSIGGFGGIVGGGSSSSSSSSGSSGFGGSGISSLTVNDNIGLSGIHPGPTIDYNEQEAYISHLANFQPAQISKHFYIHTAPEDHDEQQIVRYVNVGRPQKNYRVVFINAPTSTTSKAKIIANVAPVEDKTAIYVLSKKSNALDVSAEVVTQRPVNNKPEVFFIKYKTPQEAIHAQQTIQANYDALGGSSQTSDEGIVPVSSVIGSLGDNGASGVLADGGHVNVIGTGGAPNVDAGYTNLAGIDADGSSRQVITTSGISSGVSSGISSGLATGTNAQVTYLPVKPVRK